MSIQFLAFRDRLIEGKKALQKAGFCPHRIVWELINSNFYCPECAYENNKEMIEKEEIVIP